MYQNLFLAFMGILKVTKLSNAEERASYMHQLLKDIKALELMIEEGLIEKSPVRIGAEQEFCLVDNQFMPNGISLEVLKELNDDHFTTEIGNYNLEINLDPVELKDNCFSELHNNLNTLLNKARKVTKAKDSKILLTGILPTLTLDHMSISNMTPIQRYYVLNEALVESRKQEFDIHIKGVDELNFLHDSVMLEGCNTSFQMHLQIDPDDFIDKYNWAQAISGPVLAACTNSPLLFGKELWSETRISLFTQSVDTRANSFLLNEKQSRVSFGSKWEEGSISNIFKKNVSRFRSLVTSEYIKDSVEMLENGEIPKLLALNLHNGTVYRWNRICYGVGGRKPHLRIENRYIPSGPSVVDEIANLVFWVGIMVGQSEKYKEIHKMMDFRDAKSNFFNAARYGMTTQFYWDGELISSHKLIFEELLPMAFKGLLDYGVLEKDAQYYLGIIENRIKSNNGSQWMIKSYRNLLKKNKPFEAVQILTSSIHKKQTHDLPVSKWKTTDQNAQVLKEDQKTVRHKMSMDTFTVDVKDSLELVLNIMQWRNIHHVPVINKSKKLIGLLTWRDIKGFLDDKEMITTSVKSIMIKDVITITQDKSLSEAKEMMKRHRINGIPVVKKGKLIGIITSNDI